MSKPGKFGKVRFCLWKARKQRPDTVTTATHERDQLSCMVGLAKHCKGVSQFLSRWSYHSCNDTSLGLQLITGRLVWPARVKDKPFRTCIPIARCNVIGFTAEDIRAHFQKATKGVSNLQLERILLSPSYPFIPWPKTKHRRTELESFLASSIIIILFSGKKIGVKTWSWPCQIFSVMAFKVTRDWIQWIVMAWRIQGKWLCALISFIPSIQKHSFGPEIATLFYCLKAYSNTTMVQNRSR